MHAIDQKILSALAHFADGATVMDLKPLVGVSGDVILDRLLALAREGHVVQAGWSVNPTSMAMRYQRATHAEDPKVQP